jgi:hypothetical protein
MALMLMVEQLHRTLQARSHAPSIDEQLGSSSNFAPAWLDAGRMAIWRSESLTFRALGNLT